MWCRKRTDPYEGVKTPDELQERTDEIITAMRDAAKRSKIITSTIQRRVDVLEAHRGTT